MFSVRVVIEIFARSKLSNSGDSKRNYKSSNEGASARPNYNGMNLSLMCSSHDSYS